MGPVLVHTPAPTAPGTRGSRNPGCTLRRTSGRGGTAPDTRRPHNGGRHPPRGRPPATPTASNAGPQGARCEAGAGSTRPHRPHPGHAGHGAWLHAPEDERPGEGQRLTPGAPHNGGRHPPRGRPSASPTASNASHKGARCGAGAGSTRPHRPHPGHTGRGTLAAPLRRTSGRGRDSACRQRPSQRWKAPPPRGRPSATPTASSVGPQGRTLWGRCRVHCPHRPRPGHAGRGTWLHAPEDERPRKGQCLTPDAPHNGGRQPPPGTPFRHPHGEQRRPARAHAVGPVLGPHAHIDRARDTRVAEPWLRAPEDERPGKGQRLTPGAPHNGGKHPPRGRHSASPTASSVGPRGRTLWDRCWVHTPVSTAPGTHGSRNPGCTLRRTSAAGGGTAPDTRRPSQRWKAPPRGRPSATPTASNAGPQGRTLWGRCWVHMPASTAPGTRGSRNPGCTLRRTSGRGRDGA